MAHPSLSPTNTTSVKKPKLEHKFSRIADGFTSLQQVTEELTKSGLESSNLIVGIDFTKSNEWTGKNSFHGSSLHHVGTTKNPYEQAISIIGRTLSSFDEDNLIPCFGFGDASTHDKDVFSFYMELDLQKPYPTRGSDLLTWEFTNLKYSRVEIDEMQFEWAECMLDYI
ncbi:hypothetical protein ZIOFF_067328 [Zingiber officinale]|uniref:Copine C-terminal domain-containing protein n=1 Tax=Zingiber officinale TaxID=94328 RepID=A0A8J5C653_ZINOF|nr:hypothetical protein ZIOFF_067328 [Zingiber officinale]